MELLRSAASLSESRDAALAEYARFGGAAFPWPGNQNPTGVVFDANYRTYFDTTITEYFRAIRIGVKQEIADASPCGGIDGSPTNERERVLSDAELATLWPRLDPALKLILLNGQRSGEVVAMEKDHVAEGLMPLPSLRRRPRFPSRDRRGATKLPRSRRTKSPRGALWGLIMPETRDALFALASALGSSSPCTMGHDDRGDDALARRALRSLGPRSAIRRPRTPG